MWNTDTYVQTHACTYTHIFFIRKVTLSCARARFNSASTKINALKMNFRFLCKLEEKNWTRPDLIIAEVEMTSVPFE